MSRSIAALIVFAVVAPAFAQAADLTLLAGGKSDYQIVVPDKLPTDRLTESLAQTARLVQTAFAANGAEVAVVKEADRDLAKPAIFLGDTKFARSNGFDPATIDGWGYVQRVVGRDLVIAGSDRPAVGHTGNDRRPSFDCVGTAKGAADFVRQFAGVRFLYPDITPYSPLAVVAKVDLLKSPAIEFLKTPLIAVPADLNVAKTPVLRANTAHPTGSGFYDLANNRLPRVDEMFDGHTWERAVPPEKYYAEHPEYFALLSGSREKPAGGRSQYCLSNSDVQELIYRDLASRLERGFRSVDLGQPDGFRQCQCEECKKLYGTAGDWSEKIWLFNRQLAERLEKSHPGRQVTMMSYILTAKPPKTFKKFPTNTAIMLTGTNEEDIAPWREYDVPRGFTGYVYNWCPNLATRYTPMRTPAYVEAQAKRLATNRIQSIYRDGPGQLFGLEGPTYYVMGRMFDDPEQNAAKDLLPEFCDAAFGESAFSMRSFYHQLFHAIVLYSDHLGTRSDVWTYPPIEGSRRPKTVTDPFQLLAFLYSPNVLSALEADLVQAEKLARSPKVKARLELVRTEFDYVRHLSKVVHLYQAFQFAPDVAARDRLLDAIDGRNAAIEALYDRKRSAQLTAAGWAYVLFPFNGHDARHLRLAHDGYQEPFANTCLNWDTAAMRSAPMPGKKTLGVARAGGPVTLDSPVWQSAAKHDLTIVPPLNKLPRKTTVQLLYDDKRLYIRAESELEPDGPTEFAALHRDRPLTNQEAFDIYLAPLPGRDTAYRLAIGANGGSKYDAVAGLIADVMDPRHGKDDPTFNGDWQGESQVDADSKRWRTLISIPFESLGVKPPAAGITWRANFARYHLVPPHSKIDYSIWSSALGNTDMDDRKLFGEITFE